MYSTGRNLKDMLTVASSCDLIRPDYASCGVGTELYSFPSADERPSTAPNHKRNSPPDWMRRSAGSGISEEEYDASILDRDICWPSWCPSRDHAHFDNDWLQTMRREFNRNKVVDEIKVKFVEFHVNGTRYHDPWRLSVSARAVHLGQGSEESPHTLAEIYSTFKEYKILVSGAGEWRYLDILPQSGGKLSPILHLTEKLERKMEEVLVCGDSGNDIDMFAHPMVRGCCVGNAQPDLLSFLRQNPSESQNESVANLRGLRPTANVCFAPEPCAGGILYAMKHFDLL